MELSPHNIMVIHMLVLIFFILGAVSGIFAAKDKSCKGYGVLTSSVLGYFITALIRYFIGG